MSDAKLAAFFASDEAPSRDPGFRVAMLAQREQKRFRRQMAAAVGLGAAGLVALGVLQAAIPGVGAKEAWMAFAALVTFWGLARSRRLV
jgi:hypothetical protein